MSDGKETLVEFVQSFWAQIVAIGVICWAGISWLARFVLTNNKQTEAIEYMQKQCADHKSEIKDQNKHVEEEMKLVNQKLVAIESRLSKMEGYLKGLAINIEGAAENV